MTIRRRTLIVAIAAIAVGCTSDDGAARPDAAAGAEATAAITTSPITATPPPEPSDDALTTDITSSTTDTPAIDSTTTTQPRSDDEPATTIDMATDEGLLSVGGELPDDVDPLVIVPDDFEVAIGSFTDLSAGVTGSSRRPVDEIVQFYVTSLTDVTGVEPSVERVTDAIVQVVSITDDAEATVVVSPGPDQTTSITIAVER